MDKEEFRIKLEEINKLVEKKDYQGAMEIVDSIDWRRVKNVRTLCVVGEIYAANKRYEESKEIFLLAYHRAPIGKTILYRLIEVAIKMENLSEAEEFYEEFLEVAPNDNTRFILKYKILSAKRAPLDEQIAVLEEYKNHEYTERWSYELAKLYYKAGEKEKCIETCDDLVLWFNDGRYVTKALDLKMRMGALTGAQKKKYEEALTPKLKTKEELSKEPKREPESDEFEPKIDTIKVPKKDDPENMSILESTGLFQEKISRGIKDIFSGKAKEKETESEETEENIENMLEGEQTSHEIPKLEPEVIPASPVSADEPEEIKMPEAIKIPKPVEIPKAAVLPNLVPSQEEIQAAVEADQAKKKELEEKSGMAEEETEVSEDATKEFDLEESILAAASAQGIQIEEADSGKPEDGSEFSEEAEEIGEEEQEAAGEEPSAGEEDLYEEESEEESVPEEEEEALLETSLDEEMLPNLEEKIIETAQEEVRKEEPASLSEEEELERIIAERNPQPEVDLLDLIPRDMKLDDSEKKLFTYFSAVPGIPEQLVEALADIQQAAADKTSRKGNVIIMGAVETGKTRLSQGLVLAACRELHLEAAKTATITGGLLNEKEPAEIVDKLSGGFLIVESAGQMTEETIDKLNQAMEFRTDGLTVVIEDEKISMRKLIAKYPKFAAKFTSMINIPVFTNDELVRFAKVYTKENGYVMDQMGILALYNLIGDNQKEDEPMTIGKVKDMVDGAISRAESGARKLKRNISKKRVDEDGRIILYEKDFN